MNWADRMIKWAAKYGTNSITILTGLAILIIILLLSQFVGVLSIETVFRLTVIGALLQILLVLIELREQKQIGVEPLEELPSLIKLVKDTGAKKVYCLAHTFTRSDTIIKDLIEKTPVEVHAICSNPRNVTVLKHKREIIANVTELLGRLQQTNRIHLYLTTNRPTVPGWILVDAYDRPLSAIVGWYTYHEGDTEVHSVRNPLLFAKAKESYFAGLVADWALKEFKRHKLEGSAIEISRKEDIGS